MLKLSNELKDALMDQIKLELESFYLYHALATWLESLNWHNASHFYTEQAQEEFEHAKEFEKFLVDMGVQVEFKQLSSPPSSYPNIEVALKAALEHEIEVSHSIENLYKIASENNDVYAFPLLQRFLEEQIEEVALAQEVLERYRYFKDNELYWDHRMKRKDFNTE